MAVKTVAADLPALTDRRGTALARFEREAKAAARLATPTSPPYATRPSPRTSAAW
ncbi:hypothetical protein ACF09K_32110 [Streptomyces sp. NPDC014882]|uniref:hypothetical protein n=1 Tax=Streptomyces sp. NPDC014882 TaxID=3364927 RepID=UPI0036FE0C89